LTAELAGKANGKFFTSNTKLAANGQLTNLADGEYISEDQGVLLNLIQFDPAASRPKYRLRIQKYTKGTSFGRFIYSLIEVKGDSIII